jgi:hypothetical protein
MYNIKIHMLAIILLIIGGLNFGFSLLNYNLVQKIAQFTHWSVEPLISCLIFSSALYLMFNRNTYLPFLGEMAYPCDSLAKRVPDNANTTVNITVKPNSNIIYWASETSNGYLQDPNKAYDGYDNYGVIRSNNDGVAELKFRYPQEYVVPGMFGKKKLNKHVHYRYCLGNGLLSEIVTVFI